MSLVRDDIRGLYAKMRVASLVGIPSNQELMKLEDHFLAVLPEGWDKDVLHNAFYEHCKSARGKFFPHPNELLQAHEANHGWKRGGGDNARKDSGCDLCDRFGNGNGYLPVTKAEPAMRPSYHAKTSPRMVTGVLRCFCRPGPQGEPSNAPEWLGSWLRNTDWHREAVNAIKDDRSRNNMHFMFDEQRALAARVMEMT